MDDEGDGLFLAAIEAAPDGIVLVDGDGAVVLVNGQMEALFGYTRDELVGQQVEVLLPAAVRSRHVGHRAQFAAQPALRPMGSGIELEGRRKDGSALPVDVSLSPLRAGGADLVMALVRDVSERRRAEEHLAELAAIVEGSGDAIFSQDAQGHITSWNRAAERLYGYSGASIIGQPADVLAFARGGKSSTVFERVLAGERVERLEAEQRRADGSGVRVALTMSPLFDRGGRLVGTAVIARDISEQEQAQATLAASEERLREGEALAHVGSWSLDVATLAMQWSEELHKIYDIDPLDFGGTLSDHFGAVDRADRAALEAAFQRATDDGEPFELEHGIATPGGEGRHVYTRGAPVLDVDGTVVGIRGICQDVTEQHRASEAMRAAYERERSAAEDLRVAAAMKDDFLSIVSHELRTPLTSIIGFTALLDGLAEGDRAEVHRRISRNATEMQRMVERLLDFSRLQSGAVYLQPTSVDLREEIERNLVQLDGVLDAHDVVIDVPPSLAVLADRDAFAHVLTNLLSNAAKFSPAGTSIEVRGSASGSEVLVAVADHGHGIDAELREKVFERFFQAVPSPTGTRGAGVGLAIVREYVQRQGGRVWCESTPGKGSTFLFTLPAGKPGA